MAKESNITQIEENKQKQMQAEQEQIRQRVKQIKHQILVLSGKGGVGKSTVAVNLAVSLALSGKSVGLLDIDIHGPRVPKILNLEGKSIQAVGNTLLPVEMLENLRVMSIGFLLRGSDDAVIWRGPMKYQMIKQFLKDNGDSGDYLYQASGFEFFNQEYEPIDYKFYRLYGTLFKNIKGGLALTVKNKMIDKETKELLAKIE